MTIHQARQMHQLNRQVDRSATSEPTGHIRKRPRFTRAGLALIVVVAVLLPGIAAAQVDDAHTISGQGIGAAIVGSSLGNMQAQLGASFDFVDVGPIVVDVDGYEVRQDGELQFYAGQIAGETGLNFLLVDNPDYQTAAGIGPESTIADAVAVYGQPTISFNNENEGREL